MLESYSFFVVCPVAGQRSVSKGLCSEEEEESCYFRYCTISVEKNRAGVIENKAFVCIFACILSNDLSVRKAAIFILWAGIRLEAIT